MILEEMAAIVALIVVIIGALWKIFRVEARTITNTDSLREFKAQHSNDINELKMAHQALETMMQMEIKSLQSGINQIIGAVGELKGELRGINRNVNNKQV